MTKIINEIPNKSGRLIKRNTDSEYKILDNLAQMLGNNRPAKGTVTIFSERPACASCLDVAKQFETRYPGIKVKILDNNGEVLNPNNNKFKGAKK